MVALILDLLQLAPGVFALFYHYALGKFGKKVARLLGTFFVFGFLFTSISLFLATFLLTEDSELLRAIMAGIFIALGVAGGVFYYRRGSGSRLYISRRLAHAFQEGAKNPKGPIEAFLLGAVSGVTECIFTVPLFIMATLQIKTFESGIIQFDLAAALFAIVIIPFLIIFVAYQSGANLADIMRMRARNKGFNRLMLCFLFMLLAAGLYNFGVF